MLPTIIIYARKSRPMTLVVVEGWLGGEVFLNGEANTLLLLMAPKKRRSPTSK
jgi:hypothetical protein